MSDRLLISLPVWGEWHTTTFFQHVLPVLWAEGPEVMNRTMLLIHTKKSEKDRFRGIPQSRIISDIPEEPSHTDSIALQTMAWRQDIEVADRSGCNCFLLAPDLILSKGMLPLYLRLLDEGWGAIIQHSPRVNYVEACFVELLATDNSPRDLARIALKYEHHLSWGYRCAFDHFIRHAELVNWLSECGHFMLSMPTAIPPRAINPRIFSLTNATLLVQDLSEKLYVVQDSDEAISLSLAPSWKDLHWLVGNAPMVPRQLISFCGQYPSETSRHVASLPYLLHDKSTIEDASSCALLYKEHEKLFKQVW